MILIASGYAMRSAYFGFGVPFALMAGCGVIGTAALLLTDRDTPRAPAVA